MNHHLFTRMIKLIAVTVGCLSCSCSKGGGNQTHGVEVSQRIEQIRASKKLDQEKLVEMGKQDALYRINKGKPTIIVSGGIAQSIPGLGERKIDRDHFEFKYLPTNCADADLAKLWTYSESFNSTMLNR